MARIGRLLFLFALVVLIGVFALACSDNDDDDSGSGGSGGSDSKVCEELDDVDEAVNDVRNLDANSSLNDIRSTLSDVTTALNGLRAAIQDEGSDLAQRVEDEVDSLEGDLTSAIRSGDRQQITTELHNAADKAKSSVSDAKSDSGCN